MPVSIVGVDGAEEGQAGLVGGFLEVFLPAGLVAPAGVLVALLGNYFDQQDIAAAPAVAQAPERLDVLLGYRRPARALNFRSSLLLQVIFMGLPGVLQVDGF